MSPALLQGGGPKSAEEMDEERKEQIVYEYLCRLEEAKKWIEHLLKEELPEVTIFEQNLRNGVVLAKLASYFAPTVVNSRKIFDIEELRFGQQGLHFRHTDNINYFLKAVASIGLPDLFQPETTDVYDAKNIPRVIYCLHALSLFLYKLGKAPQMQDLSGKATFTEEQISAMKSALDSYGIPMPQFKRIGGILAEEMPVDEAAFHAAILAINKALDGQDWHVTLIAMQNPNACLNDIDSNQDPAKKYHLVLAASKEKKVLDCNNRPLDYVPSDIYDEYLTHEEIQTHVDKINQLLALERIEECVKNRDHSALQVALSARHLSLNVPLKNSLMKQYMLELERRLKGGSRGGDDGMNFLRKEDVENALIKVNAQGSTANLKNQAVAKVNAALEHRDEKSLISALKDPVLGISEQIWAFAGALYMEELNYVREGCKSDIRYEGIKKLCQFLSIIAEINKAVQDNDLEAFASLLTSPGANIEDVKEANLGQYMKACKQKSPQLFNHGDLQEIIDDCNNNFTQIEAIREVNEAVEKCDVPRLKLALLNSDLALQVESLELSDDDTIHILCLMRDYKANLSLAENEERELWIEHIYDIVKDAIEHKNEAIRAGTALAIVNMAVMQGDPVHTVQTLMHEDLNLQERVFDEEATYRQRYQEQLQAALQEKEAHVSPWITHRLSSGDKVYLNLRDHVQAWRTPSDYKLRSYFLTAEEIAQILHEVNSEMNGRHKFESNVVKLQARIRGFLVRQRLFSMLQHYYENERKIAKIQALWKGRKIRQIYGPKLRKLRENRGPLLGYYKRHEKQIILLQRVWRAKIARKEFRKLLESNNVHKNMDILTVRKFLHLLDLRPEDFSQELELQNLKGDITKKIRLIQGLEKDIDTMDIKIGLLVKNRIDVEEVVAHGKHLNKKLKEKNVKTSTENTAQGLKALKKESREKLDAYQHLFYALQTDPTYLAKLIFAMPQSSSTKFLDSVILTLYNFGANQREEYLLLKLFRTALEEEVCKKVEKLNDIVSGNPMVIKMIVGFYKSGQGQVALREVLGPLVKQVLDNKDLHINTNPVEIYKQWINAKELESGVACGMPYNVTQEEALKHEEVKMRLNNSITKLKQVTTLFLATIVKARAKLPYGILYMAKVLQNALQQKFPLIPQKELLKIVGNLIYYRYINSAIVAPDAFNIVDVSAEKSLNNEQRRNLGSVAKILQFAATKKGFGEESPHLTCLNPYIVECHEKFKKFFSECCGVAEPEDAFCMDQFTEATLIAKPLIYISLQELYDTHVLLIDHLDAIAPSKKDPLRELLEDLGDSPSICSLLGAAKSASSDGSLAHLAKTEVCLTLSNKFSVPLSSHQQLDMDKLFVKTKQLIMVVLPCTSGDNLIGCLKSKTQHFQEQQYWQLIDKKVQVQQAAKVNASMIDHTDLFKDDDGHLSLDESKRLILKNLQILERHGYVTSKDGCLALITSLARDICNQRSYRSRRRREIFKLHKTISDLETKIGFHQSQVDYYDQYLKQCLSNLHVAKKKRVHFKIPGAGNNGTLLGERSFKREILRYSASKLHNKGLLLSIDGLPENQFKNVLFEIVPMQHAEGLFQIHAKFMGVRLEHVEVDIQDLLQLQYDGVAVMNMFGKAKINVNLLLHFLNAKFYGRAK